MRTTISENLHTPLPRLAWRARSSLTTTTPVSPNVCCALSDLSLKLCENPFTYFFFWRNVPNVQVPHSHEKILYSDGDSEHHQHVPSYYLYHIRTILNISWQSIHLVFRNAAYRQTLPTIKLRKRSCIQIVNQNISGTFQSIHYNVSGISEKIGSSIFRNISKILSYVCSKQWVILKTQLRQRIISALLKSQTNTSIEFQYIDLKLICLANNYYLETRAQTWAAIVQFYERETI